MKNYFKRSTAIAASFAFTAMLISVSTLSAATSLKTADYKITGKAQTPQVFFYDIYEKNHTYDAYGNDITPIIGSRDYLSIFVPYSVVEGSQNYNVEMKVKFSGNSMPITPRSLESYLQYTDPGDENVANNVDTDQDGFVNQLDNCDALPGYKYGCINGLEYYRNISAQKELASCRATSKLNNSICLPVKGLLTKDLWKNIKSASVYNFAMGFNFDDADRGKEITVTLVLKAKNFTDTNLNNNRRTFTFTIPQSK